MLLNQAICISWNISVLIVFLLVFKSDNFLRRKLLHITNKKQGVQENDYIVTSSSIFQWQLIDFRHLYQSPILSLLGILIFRILSFVGFFAIFFTFEYVGNDGIVPAWLTFYTHWTLITFALYWIFGIFTAFLRYLETKQHSNSSDDQSIKKEDRGCNFTEKIFIILGSITICCSFLAGTLFWIFFPGTDLVLRFKPFTSHGINCLLLIIDLFLTRLPIMSSHFIFPLIFSQIYVSFLWTYGTLSGEWVYKAMNWKYTFGVYMNVFVMFVLLAFFILMYFLASFRERIFFNNQKYQRSTEKNVESTNQPKIFSYNQPQQQSPENIMDQQSTNQIKLFIKEEEEEEEEELDDKPKKVEQNLQVQINITIVEESYRKIQQQQEYQYQFIKEIEQTAQKILPGEERV